MFVSKRVLELETQLGKLVRQIDRMAAEIELEAERRRSLADRIESLTGLLRAMQSQLSELSKMRNRETFPYEDDSPLESPNDSTMSELQAAFAAVHGSAIDHLITRLPATESDDG